MFVRCVKKPYAWNGNDRDMVINTEHIIAVEMSRNDGSAIVTCTGKMGDEVLYYMLEDKYEEFLERIMG